MRDNPLDWDISNNPDTSSIEESEKKAYEENLHFLKTFSTQSGKKVLEWLIRYTLESPTWWPGKSPDFGYYREGQNHLVRQIKDKINKAKNYEAKK